MSAEYAHNGLRLRGITKSYSGIQILHGIDLDIREGEVVAFLGENGAGKSTVSSIIAGLVEPNGGSMTWHGEHYQPKSPGDAIASGIGLIHQEMRLLEDLTIAENIFIGRLPMKNGHVDREYMNRKATEQLRRIGLNVSPTRKVSSLRIAAQQQVEIAKALMLNARLLILDEPTAALGAEETDLLFEQINRLRTEGVSFIYISHRLEEIARIADRVVVMRDGRMIAQHETAQVPVETLLQEMVGRDIHRIFPEPTSPTEIEVLRVENLTSSDGSFHNVSFSVHAGEVFGIAGIVGAGRTELVRAIAGADAVTTGKIHVDGNMMTTQRPDAAIKAGIVLVPEDRKAQGVVLEHSVTDNLALGNMNHLASHGWAYPARLRGFAEGLIKNFGVKCRADQQLRYLSGGNQQKVIIARWIAQNPKVFILDEPTRGIDMGARAAIYDVIAGLAQKGMAVIVVSSDLEEVLGLSHRVMVLARGQQMGILDRGDATGVSVMELATA